LAVQVDDVAVKIDKGLHEYEKQQRLLEISTQSTFVRADLPRRLFGI
jgi:hypothetical protein